MSTEKLNRNKDSVLFLAKSRWSAIRKASSRWEEGQGKREQRLPFQRAREKNVCGRENECGTCIRRCANESAPILLRSRIDCICSSLSSPAQPTFSRGSDLSSISSSFLPPKKKIRLRGTKVVVVANPATLPRAQSLHASLLPLPLLSRFRFLLLYSDDGQSWLKGLHDAITLFPRDTRVLDSRSCLTRCHICIAWACLRQVLSSSLTGYVLNECGAAEARHLTDRSG